MIDPCDQDDDGQLSNGGACGGLDCDDHDEDVFFGQPAYFAVENLRGTFDYDCRNGVEREFTCAVNTCGLLSTCGTAQCYLGTSLPPCGGAGPWGSCVTDVPLVSCKDSVIENNRPVRCH